MVYFIDAFLVGLEFSQEELEAISHRRFLYVGIGIMIAINIAFIPLVIGAFIN